MPTLYRSGGQKSCRSDAGQEDTQYKAFYRLRRAVKLVILCGTGGKNMMFRHCTGLKGTQGADSAGQDIWDANLVQSTRDVDLAQCKRTFGVQSMCRARWHSSYQPQYNAYGSWGADMVIGEGHSGCRSCTGEEDTGYMV